MSNFLVDLKSRLILAKSSRVNLGNDIVEAGTESSIPNSVRKHSARWMKQEGFFHALTNLNKLIELQKKKSERHNSNQKRKKPNAVDSFDHKRLCFFNFKVQKDCQKMPSMSWEIGI